MVRFIYFQLKNCIQYFKKRILKVSTEESRKYNILQISKKLKIQKYENEIVKQGWYGYYYFSDEIPVFYFIFIEM